MSRLKVPIVLAVAAIAIGYLLVSGISQNDLYVSSLDEFDATRAGRERVRVMGFVDEGSVMEDPQRLVTSFRIRNEASTRSLAVRYDGVLPDLFRDGANLIAAGRLDAEGTFVADDLMTKCPSKYEGLGEEHPGSVPRPGTEAGSPAGASAL